jgi:Membrane protein involved in the export of O-antigen and teichoic acid
MKNEIEKKTKNGFYWMTAGKIIQGAVRIIVLTILARLIRPDEFGIVAAAMVVISFAEILSQIGLGQVLIKKRNLTEGDISLAHLFSIATGILFALLIIGTAPLFSGIFGIKEMHSVLTVLSIVFPINGIATVSESLIQRNLRFRIYSLIIVSSYLGYAICGIIFAGLGFGLWALVIATLANATIKSGLLVFFQRHSWKLKLSRNGLKELVSQGTGFSIIKIFDYLSQQIDNLIVGKWLGPAALGIYSRTFQLVATPTALIGQVFDKVLFPALALVQGKNEMIKKTLYSGTTAISLVVPISVLLTLLSEEFIEVLLGQRWTAAVVPFSILSIGIYFRLMARFLVNMIKATGSVFNLAALQGINVVTIFLASLIGVNWGINGVSWGILISVIMNYLLLVIRGLKLIQADLKKFIISHRDGIMLALLKWLLLSLMIEYIEKIFDSPVIVIGISTASTVLIYAIYVFFNKKKLYNEWVKSS